MHKNYKVLKEIIINVNTFIRTIVKWATTLEALGGKWLIGLRNFLFLLILIRRFSNDSAKICINVFGPLRKVWLLKFQSHSRRDSYASKTHAANSVIFVQISWIRIQLQEFNISRTMELSKELWLQKFPTLYHFHSAWSSQQIEQGPKCYDFGFNFQENHCPSFPIILETWLKFKT